MLRTLNAGPFGTDFQSKLVEAQQQEQKRTEKNVVKKQTKVRRRGSEGEKGRRERKICVTVLFSLSLSFQCLCPVILIPSREGDLESFFSFFFVLFLLECFFLFRFVSFLSYFCGVNVCRSGCLNRCAVVHVFLFQIECRSFGRLR